MIPDMLEPKAADIINHGDPGYLSLDLPGNQLQQDKGRGIILLHRHSGRVPLACRCSCQNITALKILLTKSENINPPAKLVPLFSHSVEVVAPHSVQPKIIDINKM